tara:strand:- start:4751 stop:5818 length:1068 start_codon:yes stop_codon:yes gene_type:complete
MFNKKDYKNVGDTSLKVSPITLGTMTFGDQNTEAEAFHQLDFALEKGINSFDLAEMYPVPPKRETCSRTETIFGNWLTKQKRDDLIISTKIAGPRRNIDWIRGGNLSFNKKNILQSVEDSLIRMQTNHVDLLYLHWPERNVPMFGEYKFDPSLEYEGEEKINWVSIEEQLDVLGQLVKDGKVRFIALSNEWAWGVMEFLRVAREKKLPIICNIQNNFSLINRIPELGLTEIMFRENLSFFAYSPLGFGHLSGKYIKNPTSIGRVTLFKGYAKRFDKPGVHKAVSEYVKLAEEIGISPACLALSFVYHQWFVTSTVIGATNLNQLKENIDAYKFELDKECLRKIDDIHLACMNPAP